MFKRRIFSTKHVIPESLKFCHWLSESWISSKFLSSNHPVSFFQNIFVEWIETSNKSCSSSRIFGKFEGTKFEDP